MIYLIEHDGILVLYQRLSIIEKMKFEWRAPAAYT